MYWTWARNGNEITHLCTPVMKQCNAMHPDHFPAFTVHRELAQQVATDARALRRVWGLRVAAIFGGADRGQQIALLAKEPHVLVATPGRLLDLIDDGALTLGKHSPMYRHTDIERFRDGK